MQLRAKECEHSFLIALLNIIKDYSIAMMVELVRSVLSGETVLSILFFETKALICAVVLDSASVNLGLMVVNGDSLRVSPSGLLLGDITFVVLRVPGVLALEVLELFGE